MGFNDEDEVDLFDLSAGQPKPEDYGTETNVFALEFDVPESKPASPALPPEPAPSPAPPAAPAGVEEEFDLSGAVSTLIDDDGDEEFSVEKEGFFSKIKSKFAKPAADDGIDFEADADDTLSDDDEFPVEKEGFFSKIKGKFAKPAADDDIDFEADADDTLSDDDEFPVEKEGFFSKIKGKFAKPAADDDIDFEADADDTLSDDDEFPVEKEGFFSKIKGKFAKPAADEDIDFDADADDTFSDDDEFPVEKESFFSKIKGAFAKPEDDDNFDDSLPDDDDYTPALPDGEINKLDKDGDGGDVFDLSAPAVAPAAPVPPAEPEFEAFEPEPAASGTARVEDGGEFGLSAGVPPPPPAPAPLPPPVFNRFAHVCLYVKDLGASVDFYAGLGFKKRFAFNKNGGLFGVYLEFGSGNFIELFEDARGGLSATRGSIAHFCLETPDIDAAAESLSSRGIPFTPKKLGSDSTYQIWLKDPDGNEFEIHQYTQESSQLVGRDVEADW